jgi:hypothetical protein
METHDTWQDRGDIFKVSYQEVLLALKHQDDKVNRMLTGIAFLTAAGITLYSRFSELPSLRFDGQPLSVPTFLFLAFISSVALALALTLAAIGPSSNFAQHNSKRLPSLLYFATISADKEWPQRIENDPAALTKMLAENYHAEARELARRVNYKILRAREASAFLHIVVASLGLLGIFSLQDVGSATRWWVASSFVILLLALPLWDLFRMRQSDFEENLEFKGKAYRRLAWAICLVAILLILGEIVGWHWWAIGYALGVLLASRLALARTKEAIRLLGLAGYAGILVIAIVLVGAAT